MNEDRWRKIEELYHAARLLKESARSSFLAAATEGDDELRREVESLLASGASSPGILDEPVQTAVAPARVSDAASLSGRRIGTYSVHERIGAGGMGEVYRAHDSKLHRDVALKVLSADLIGQSDRQQDHLRRFRHEALALAALNHPNIAAIYGLEEAEGVTALVMELVEGSTLADRIVQGSLPPDEALPIAKQIADALEAAHERGIVHRDLKPANIKLRPDGTVKVLDFGLAKAVGPAAGPLRNVSQRATSTTPVVTATGIIVGTAAYMSPEQATGKAVDHRTDIWAFGCVLFEMLSGRVAFGGDTLTDTLAAVMRAEADWSQLPAATPKRVRVLLQRCLQKDPKQRLQAIGEARISLDEVLSGAPEGAPLLTAPLPLGRRALPWALGLIAAAITGVAVWVLKPPPAPPLRPVMRLQIPLPENVPLRGFQQRALSPNGTKLAFIATGADHQSRLWVQSLDTAVARPLDGTEGAGFTPFWSPDSRFIGFFAQGKLKRIEASGGASLVLCDADQVYGGAWNTADTIVFASNAGVLQVAASGGSPSPIDTAGGASGPSFLPDGRHFVYFRWGGSDSGIYVGSLDAQPKGQPVKLSADQSQPVYVPSSDPAVGYLLFARGTTGGSESPGTLMAQRFDTRRFQLIGEAVPIAERVSRYTASATDVLEYRTSSDIRAQLTWFDREGKVLGTFGEPGVYRGLALSPDGKHVAFVRPDPQNVGARNIWLYEFARDLTTRFTFVAGSDNTPIWSPDGSRIAYFSFRRGKGLLYVKNSNLAGEGNLLSEHGYWPTSWSPDGRFLLFEYRDTGGGLALLPLGKEGADREPIPVEQSKFNPRDARFSPDGHWIAYQSDQSGSPEVYVRPFDVSSAVATSSGGLIVSKDGGTGPRWRPDGKELFYLGSDGNAMDVEVSTIGGVFQAARPKALFKVPADVDSWDISADGKRFLMAVPSGVNAVAPPPFTVVLNWQTALKK